jgi:hypothetical protein
LTTWSARNSSRREEALRAAESLDHARAHARKRPSRLQRLLDRRTMIARFRATALVDRPAKI